MELSREGLFDSVRQREWETKRGGRERERERKGEERVKGAK
jgi:hypothetical protein